MKMTLIVIKATSDDLLVRLDEERGKRSIFVLLGQVCVNAFRKSSLESSASFLSEHFWWSGGGRLFKVAFLERFVENKPT